MWWRRREKPLWRRGEDLAARHLRRAGYRILERNARFGHCEIDIIAKEGDTVAFVEVRTRADREPVSPEESVNAAKQRHLITAAKQYIARSRQPEAYYRFDVVAVVWPASGKAQVSLFRDAFHA